MSRQFDEFMEEKFDYHGELHALVKPQSFSGLMDALQAKDELQEIISTLPHDEDDSSWQNLLQIQHNYIEAYLEGIGEFDNSILISNINYFAKSNLLKLGELERMLGVSAGYISRTAKENTGKRLSIDVVWKLAKFFEVDISDLINRDFRIPIETSDLLLRFMRKLIIQTETDSIDWNCEGGYMIYGSEVLGSLPLFTAEDECVVYHPDHLNQQIKWVLCGDVYSCNSIAENQSLAIITFNKEGNDAREFFDFIFFWKNKDGTYSWKKAFYCNDPYVRLEEYAAPLFDLIEKKVDAARVAPDVRSIILSYLK